MKAIVHERFGSPDVLEYKEVDKPVPGDDDVLVKVFASSVNFNNLVYMSGKPAMARMMGVGLFKPKYRIAGGDIAGVVEAVGKNIQRFHPGDEVYGELSEHGFGAYAGYVSVPEKFIAPKPSNWSFSEAAAAAQSAVVALQGLREKGKIKQGDKVLIYGASGGIGTFAVQIAKAFGAEVTGVCSTKNFDLVRSLGADHLIDYTKEDFVKSGPYDLILTTAGYRPISDYKKALAAGGRYVLIGGSMKGEKAMSQIMESMMLAPFMSLNSDKKMGALTMVHNPNDLIDIKELAESGKIRSVIDRSYPLSEVAEAFRYYENRHAKGKVVITVSPD